MHNEKNNNKIKEYCDGSIKHRDIKIGNILIFLSCQDDLYNDDLKKIIKERYDFYGSFIHADSIMIKAHKSVCEISSEISLRTIGQACGITSNILIESLMLISLIIDNQELRKEIIDRIKENSQYWENAFQGLTINLAP